MFPDRISLFVKCKLHPSFHNASPTGARRFLKFLLFLPLAALIDVLLSAFCVFFPRPKLCIFFRAFSVNFFFFSMFSTCPRTWRIIAPGRSFIMGLSAFTAVCSAVVSVSLPFYCRPATVNFVFHFFTPFCSLLFSLKMDSGVWDLVFCWLSALFSIKGHVCVQ